MAAAAASGASMSRPTETDPTFFCASFFLLVHPTPPLAIFFLKPLSFLDLRTTLFSRKRTCKGWVLGMGLEGAAPQEKGISFQKGAQKKGE